MNLRILDLPDMDKKLKATMPDMNRPKKTKLIACAKCSTKCLEIDMHPITWRKKRKDTGKYYFSCANCFPGLEANKYI